jgi:hypothetical protein
MLAKVKCAIVGLFLLLGLGCGAYDPTLLTPDGGADHALHAAQDAVSRARSALLDIASAVEVSCATPECGARFSGPLHDANQALLEAEKTLRLLEDAKAVANDVQSR